MNPSCWLHSSQFKRLNRRQRRIGRLSDKNVSGAGRSCTLPSVGSLMPCRKIPSVCTKSSVRVTWCYIPNCTPRSHGAGLLYQQARPQSKPGRWQLWLPQWEGEALTCSRGWAGLGFASEVGGSGVVPHEVGPQVFFRKCGWSWISRKAYFSGIFSTFGWDWKRIHLQLNPTHQDKWKTWSFSG